MKFELPWGDNIYDCEWIAETDFDKLERVSSILGFIFDDDDKLCVVTFKDIENWTLPGGHLEDYDESFEACFIREVAEEADLELKDISKVGYISSIKRGAGEETRDHQLRYVARVHKINDQTVDPGEGYIPERKFIHADDFEEYTKWVGNGRVQLDKAIEILNLKDKSRFSS